jgi:hypothetical protein
MPTAPHRLHPVSSSGAGPRAVPEGTLEDLLLLVAIFAVALLPLVSTLAGVGRWGDGSLGLATVASIFSGRELWRLVAARVAARRRP